MLDCRLLACELEALKSKCRRLEEALALEIERNRARESALLETALFHQRQGGQSGLPPHARVLLPNEKPQQPLQDERPGIITDIDEEDVHRRAMDFYQQAKAKGIEYDFEVLKEVIRRNPSVYLQD